MLASSASGDEVVEFLPASHPVWEDVDALFDAGGFGGYPVFTRPLPRLDLAAALLETLDREPSLRGTAPARRLLRELEPELTALGAGGQEHETAPWLEWHADGARFVIQTEARLSATVTDDIGEIPPGTRAGLVARAYLPGGLFALTDITLEKIEDSNPLGDSVVKHSPWYLSSNEAYISYRTAGIDLAAGLLRNRWGPGRSGTLLLSDDALAVPGFFMGRTFGRRARFVAFTGALHHPENRWMSAHRFEIRIGDRFVWGVHEAAVYTSTGLDPLYAVGLVPYAMVQRILDRTTDEGPLGDVTRHRNNLLVGTDVTWRPLGGWRVNGELLIDDLATESSSQPDRLGFLGGVSWAGPALGSTADFRAEFAKVYQYTYSVFYGADLIRDGVPLGYSRGPDVEHALVQFERDFGVDLELGVGWEMTRKGEGIPGEPWDPNDGQSRNAGATLSGVVETEHFPHVRGRWSWRDVVTVRGSVGVLRVRNLSHSDGDSATSIHGRFELFGQW